MKKIVLCLLCLLCMVACVVSCGEDSVVSSTSQDTTVSPPVTTGQTDEETIAKATTLTTVETTVETTLQTSAETTASVTVKPLQLIEDNQPVFQVVTSMELFQDAFFNNQINTLCDNVRNIGVSKPAYSYDKGRRMTYEILVGKTNRDVKLPKLEALEWSISVQGTKVLLYSETDYGLLEAIDYFTKTYLSEPDRELTLPGNLCVVGKHDDVKSDEHGLTYAEMASATMDAFNEKFWNGKGIDIGFWEAAEIIEIYADAYERTKDEAIKQKLLSFADYFMLVNKQDWLWKNHNDSPMWACIAFTRITLLTGQKKYYEVAKKNFDAVYERSFDLELGGGLYWDTDKTTKNA